MVKIAPFKCFYPVSLTDFTVPMIVSDFEIAPDVKSIDENDLLKIPANIQTTDHKRIFQEILTLGHSRKYEALSRHWARYETLGFFRQEEVESFYVYRMTYTLDGKKFQQTGLLCLLELERNTILGHENTIRDKIDDQVDRLLEFRTSISPVSLLYNDRAQNQKINTETESNSDINISLNELLDQVTYSFPIVDLIASNDVRHTIWKIFDSKLSKKIINYFQMQEKVFIADGHHRVESSFFLKEKLKKENPNHTGEEPYNYILSAIFPISQCHILEYNRIMKNVKKFKKEILPQIKKNFNVDELKSFEKPIKKGTFVIYCKKKWYKAKLKKGVIKKNDNNIIEELDTFIIQKYIFKEVFKVKNIRTSRSIAYIPGTKPLEYLVDVANKENAVAFIVPPVSIDDILAIAEHQLVVPPKTTWFEPKILKGIMFWKF